MRQSSSWPSPRAPGPTPRGRSGDLFIVFLVDADSCGRSVPTLGNILTSVYGHPISPLVYASRNGESIVIETPDPQDTGLMETIGRSIVVGYDNILIGYCLPPLTKAECRECLVAGLPSSLQATGRALISAKETGAGPVDAVLKTFSLLDHR